MSSLVSIPLGINKTDGELESGKQWGYEVDDDSIDVPRSEMSYYWILYDTYDTPIGVQVGEEFRKSVEEIGTYTLELTALDTSQNRKETTSVPIKISEPNQEPRAGLSIGQIRFDVNQPVTFDASSSIDPDGTITEYRWIIRQLVDEEGNPVGGQGGKVVVDETTQSETFRHPFNSPGKYLASVTVRDNNDELKTSDTVNFTVEG